MHTSVTMSTFDVAPYVGAWIETAAPANHSAFVASHPMWVRGLKHHPEPHVIEQERSHPMWVRGLKRPHHRLLHGMAVSHPMWVRGLKLPWNNICTMRSRRTLCGCVD